MKGKHTWRHTLLHTVLLLVTAGLLAAGCGGSSNETGSARASSSNTKGITGPLSQQTLITEADAICEQLATKLNAADQKVKNFKRNSVARLTALFVTAEQVALVQLRKLKPPSSSEHDWQRFIAYRQEMVKHLIDRIGPAERNEAHKAEAAYQAARKVQAKMLEVAKQEGFQVCPQVG